MSAIIGYAGLVLRKTEGEISQSQRDNLLKLVNNANHLLELINSLLDLAKIEAGRMDVRVESVRLEALMAETLSMVEPMMSTGHVRLVSEIAPDDWGQWYWPTWSADGTEILAFVSFETSIARIPIFQGGIFSPGTPQRVAKADWAAASWSPVETPDGTYRIAYLDYVENEIGPNEIGLFLVDPMTELACFLVTSPGQTEWDGSDCGNSPPQPILKVAQDGINNQQRPTWSPDGTSLAFAVQEGDGLNSRIDIVTFSAPTGELIANHESGVFEIAAEAIQDLTWSNTADVCLGNDCAYNGAALALTSETGSGIRIIPAPGAMGTEERALDLLTPPFGSTLSWSPDDTEIMWRYWGSSLPDLCNPNKKLRNKAYIVTSDSLTGTGPDCSDVTLSATTDLLSLDWWPGASGN